MSVLWLVGCRTAFSVRSSVTWQYFSNRLFACSCHNFFCWCTLCSRRFLRPLLERRRCVSTIRERCTSPISRARGAPAIHPLPMTHVTQPCQGQSAQSLPSTKTGVPRRPPTIQGQSLVLRACWKCCGTRPHSHPAITRSSRVLLSSNSSWRRHFSHFSHFSLCCHSPSTTPYFPIRRHHPRIPQCLSPHALICERTAHLKQSLVEPSVPGGHVFVRCEERRQGCQLRGKCAASVMLPDRLQSSLDAIQQHGYLAVKARYKNKRSGEGFGALRISFLPVHQFVLHRACAQFRAFQDHLSLPADPGGGQSRI